MIAVYYILYLIQFVLHIAFDVQVIYKLFPKHFARRV